MSGKRQLVKLAVLNNLPTDEQTGLNTRNWSVMNTGVKVNPQFRDFPIVKSEPVRKKRATQTFATMDPSFLSSSIGELSSSGPSTIRELASSGAISTKGLPSGGVSGRGLRGRSLSSNVSSSGGFISPQVVANSGFKNLNEKVYIADLISPNRVSILTKSNIRDLVNKPR
jgi:hypothetical protein